ncbi:MAG: Cysteine-rich secretory protein family [Dehalococcoidia bacterium]|nr:Cysteine-rich secretory protein family [Dehalococcoidia bacterium]
MPSREDEHGAGQQPEHRVAKRQSGLVRWLLVLVGLFLLVGGIGYLSYPSSQAPAVPPAPATSPSAIPKPPAPAPSPPPAVSIPKEAPAPAHGELAQYALDLINIDRQSTGLTPVVLGNNTAAQKHSEDLLANSYLAHWGTDGMKPYMRYTLAGGFNYEGENAYRTWTVRSGNGNPLFKRDPRQMLEEAQKSLMASPGHRTNILTKWHKKVNVGIAYNNDSLYLVQQFEGDYISFGQLPTLQNGMLSLSGGTRVGFAVDQIQVWYDPPPHPLTLGQLDKTYAYSLGKPAAFIRPPPPPRSYYTESVSTFSREVYPDPYNIPPNTPPLPQSGTSILETPPSSRVTETVRWVEATQWNISGNSFAIRADLSQIVMSFRGGVYTIVIWAETGEESVDLTNYSIIVP